MVKTPLCDLRYERKSAVSANLFQVILQTLDVQPARLQVAVSGNGDDAQRRRCRNIKQSDLNGSTFIYNRTTNKDQLRADRLFTLVHIC